MEQQACKDPEQDARTKIEGLTKELLIQMGFTNWESDPNLKDTPARFAKYMRSFANNKVNMTGEPFKFTTFPTKTGVHLRADALAVRSLCAHHLAPFFGEAVISYTTGDVQAGLSKFQRVVDRFASVPTDQESLTAAIAEFLVDELKPLHLAVEMNCVHTCMAVRGVKNHNSKTYTRVEFVFDEQAQQYKSI